MRHPVEGVTKMNALTLAALGTGFTFLMTAAGAAVVFLFKNEIKPSFQRVLLGFAAGVMIAASVWSLLIPSIEMAGEQGVPGWLPAAGGFALGALFLMVLDALMPHLHPGSSEAEGVHTSFKRTTLLVLAVTLHNIPEGMAVAVPLISGGTGRVRATLLTAACGLPTVLGAWLGFWLGDIGPLGLTMSLGFASGAMLYVVFGEIMPESYLIYRSKLPAFAVMVGLALGMFMIFF